jgi:hypothetical protein
MIRINYLIPAAVIGACVIGCGVIAPIPGQQDPYSASQIHFADSSLAREAPVGAPRATRDPSGILFVTVPIRAATDTKLYVDYRVTWFDANHEVIFQTSWMSKTLEPNVPDQISVNSTNNRAADFQIDFRLADQ